ncbi:MAG TPA: ABC transporter permease [Vicinamibacterales bacterium]|nr:ABC transporter permease [Vicinamibacterales bacterium]
MSDWTRELAPRLASLKLSPAREAEIIEELSLHLDDRVAELAAGGASPDDARRLALAEIPDDMLARGLGRLRQAHAHEPLVPGVSVRRVWLLDLWQDARYALRMLRAQPGFSAAALITLTLGIGANSAIFGLVHAALFERLPVDRPETLLYIHNGPGPGAVFSYPAMDELRRGQTVFEGVAAWGPITASLNAGGATDLVGGLIVTGNFFELLGLQAAAGRTLTSSDDVTPGAHPVAVISHGLWQRRFGAAADVIGRPVLLNGKPFTIVGVLPRGFRGPEVGITRDLYVPMMMQPVMRPPRAGYSGEMNPDLMSVRGNSWIFAIGRMREGVGRAEIESSLTALVTALDRGRNPAAREHRIATSRVIDGVPGQRDQLVSASLLLLSIVGAVLLIACANVANLLLSRAAARQREIAVRLAIGASRWRLVRQMLTESVLLSVAGGAGGLLLAWGIARGFTSAPPPAGALPVALEFTIDPRVMLVTLALAIVTGLVFGLAPALRASRPSLLPALRDAVSQPESTRRRLTLRHGLVVAEVALTLLLLVAAGLFVRSLRKTQAIDPGFDVDRLVSAPLSINLLRYTTDQGRAFYREVVGRVSAAPGVEAASVARVAVFGQQRISSLAIEGRQASSDVFQSQGGAASAVGRSDAVATNVIDPAYFRTMGIAIKQGRTFDDADRPDGASVVVVNEAFVARHLPNQPALGTRIGFRGPAGPWRTIVGVVANSKYARLSEAFQPIVFVPLAQQHETGMTLHVRAAGDPAAIVSVVRDAIQSLEPNLPMPAILPVSDTVSTSLYAARMAAWLTGMLGGLALLLAVVGVYGVLAFSIARRTREIGIRLALGADRPDIFRLVLREGMGLVAIGIVIGLAGAALGATTLAGFLYGVEARDGLTFAMAPSILLAIALAACVLPAWRATRVPPTVAFRA